MYAISIKEVFDYYPAIYFSKANKLYKEINTFAHHNEILLNEISDLSKAY